MLCDAMVVWVCAATLSPRKIGSPVKIAFWRFLSQLRYRTLGNFSFLFPLGIYWSRRSLTYLFAIAIGKNPLSTLSFSFDFQQMRLLASFGPSHPTVISLTVMAGLWIIVRVYNSGILGGLGVWDFSRHAVNMYRRFQPGFSLSQFLSGLAFAKGSKKMILLSGPWV